MHSSWKVGPLAQASGLTVRTLHHWDAIGLLSPSSRTAGGHREYTEGDLARLYQILALRSLGLSLETIATCLDSGVDPVRLIHDHLAKVQESVDVLQTLRTRLTTLLDALSAGRTPGTDALLDALRAIGSVAPQAEDALKDHLADEQIEVLRTRSASLGPALHYLLEVEWPELYRRADRLRTEGAPATDPRVRRVVGRMDELSALFTGGDQAISQGVRTAWRENPGAMSGTPAPASDEWSALADFLDEARRTR
ncbi:MerR family transcriptional regulator [Streptomyces orinoci]|uniref:MerR family transcriptional regulator n=1 Tax=Streptomyces orinoci TaxID=67339 RepID=A0ABV3JTJ5_STRON|nr:MerR family transcriptional regulator [Streptomyces orinoci]